MGFFQKLLGESYKDGMSIEEIEKLVEQKYSILNKERASFKDSFDKTASELADCKKKYLEKLSEEEKKQLEFDNIIKERDLLVREKKIAENTSKYIGLGYSEDLAKDTAEALLNGDIDKVFENQKKYNELMKEDYAKKGLEKTPTPPAGGKKSGITKEEFDKMSVSEAMEFANNNPALYAEFSK